MKTYYPTRVAKPFYSKAKKAWVLRYHVADRKKPIEVKRKLKADILEEREKLLKQIELTGASGPYPFDTIARFHSLREMAEKAGLDVGKVIEETIARLSNGNVEITVSDLWAKYEKTAFLTKYGEKSRSTNKYTIQKFVRAYGKTAVGRIDEDEIFEYAKRLKQSLSRRSVNREMYALKALFKWAKGRQQRYIKSNPFDAWDINEIWPLSAQENRNKEKEMRILEPKDVERLLRACIENDPLFLPALILKLYGFLRTCEVRKIAPNEIDLENGVIYVSAKVAKSGKNGTPMPRTVENLSKTFHTLMAPFTGPDGRLSYLCTKRYYERLNHIYAIAFDDKRELGNELRRGCATYTYIKGNDIGLVRKNMGHRGDNEYVTWAHYVDPSVLQSKAEAFFAIRPPDGYTATIKRAFQKNLESETNSENGKPKWPADKVLRRWALELPKTEIANRVGASETAVRKRLKKLGIASPPKGHWQRLKAFQSASKNQQSPG
ncbi:phage integrase N-terminal SAM-like domain-containing protein [Pelagicoccus enzymogenes]|uniref:phage integrase N-terminal SAM-like domain-containing protein n=1 Tax=Pelagicoccus enzymogenes TaxID=2773457 RepID=UPI00280C8D9E|nr:phage integrase N-terminal SAM-like domain-containing protein [Pelagicoccus enzymogenes]MDQ8199673.1 phage integrase N-terminal SAM-like domain-containing protein [Pelagicoccus enzymogenes]